MFKQELLLLVALCCVAGTRVGIRSRQTNKIGTALKTSNNDEFSLCDYFKRPLERNVLNLCEAYDIPLLQAHSCSLYTT